MRHLAPLPILLLACAPQSKEDPRPAPTEPTADTAETGDTGTGGSPACTLLEPEGETDPFSLHTFVYDATNVDELCADVDRLCVMGHLEVAGMEDLEPLSCVQSVAGDLRLYHTEAQTLSGLEGLESVGADLTIAVNLHLQTLEGLGELSIGRRLTLTDNRRLTSLDGLEQVQIPELYIERNQRLTSLEGFSGTHLEYLLLKLNPELASLSGLESLDTLDWAVVDWLEGLTSLEGLEGLREVGYLDLRLYQASVSSLEPLRALANEGEVGTLKLTCSPQLDTLAGLDGLQTVESMSISGCEGLTSLDALSQLETVTDGDLTLSGLPLVTSLDGLGALSSVDGRMHVMAMSGLTDLRGLDALTSVSSTLNIWRNDNLRSLAGLEALRTTGDAAIDPKYTYLTIGLILDGNPVLEELDGLHDLESLHAGMAITNNTSLSQAEIDELVLAIDELTGTWWPTATAPERWRKTDSIASF